MSKISIIKEAAKDAIVAEAERTRQLLARGEKLVAGTLIATGFQLMNAGALLESSSPWVRTSGGLSYLILSLSLFFGFWSLRLKGYASYPRGDKLWENLKSEEVSHEAAETAVIQLLLKNREQNARLNDAKTNTLSWCGWLLFAGVILIVGSLVLYVFHNFAT